VHTSRGAGLGLDGLDTQGTLGHHDRYLAPAVKTARGARAAVRGMPFDEDRKERALLVVSELTTNAIVHGGGVLYLQFSRGDGLLHIEVADPSPTLPGPVKVNMTSGRGLLMVDALARAWGSDPRWWGKVVWAELD
jgi:anti-sigma regulatory factor (Ser/Thr protein kinase)